MDQTNKILIKCLFCGKDKYVRPSDIRQGRKFCNEKCYLAYVEKQKSVTCLCCGKIVSFKESIANKRKFCNQECYDKYRNELHVSKVCEHCGKAFSVYKSELIKNKNRGRFCSNKCKGDHTKFTKERQSREIVNCEFCNKEMEVFSGRVKSGKMIFCSNKCYGRWRHETIIGDNHPGKKDKYKVVCKICGNERLVDGSVLNRDYPPKYCSKDCYWKDKIKTGITYGKYCEKFNREFKNRVKEFFNNRCQLCGKQFSSGKNGLCVHHVHYDKKSCCDNTIPRKFVTLCNSCHSKTTMGDREYWTAYFEEFLDVNYNGKCYYTKEEYEKLKEENMN